MDGRPYSARKCSLLSYNGIDLPRRVIHVKLQETRGDHDRLPNVLLCLNFCKWLLFILESMTTHTMYALMRLCCLTMTPCVSQEQLPSSGFLCQTINLPSRLPTIMRTCRHKNKVSPSFFLSLSLSLFSHPDIEKAAR